MITRLMKGQLSRGLALGIALLWLSSSVCAVVQLKPVPGMRAAQTGSEVTIVASASGCTPSSMTQSAGHIRLRVINQTGSASLTIQLYNEKENLPEKERLLKEVTVQGASEWAEVLEFPAGNYKLVVNRSQALTAHLTVQ